MNENSKFAISKIIIGIVVVIVAVIGITSLFFLYFAVLEQDKIIENSNCEELTQMIKDREQTPRHDKIMTKWVQIECWK